MARVTTTGSGSGTERPSRAASDKAGSGRPGAPRQAAGKGVPAGRPADPKPVAKSTDDKPGTGGKAGDKPASTKASRPAPPKPSRQTPAAPPKAPRGSYIREVYQELRKVTWPTPKELSRMTQVVLATVVIFGFLIGGLDLLLSLIVKPIYSQIDSGAPSASPQPQFTPVPTSAGTPSAGATTSSGAASTITVSPPVPTATP